jgi:alkylhydroperoxidase/carboxymuconolactone decarboxylase family protein YurZ
VERQAWIDMPAPEQVQELVGRGGPYDFGFVAGMSRLILSHLEIAPHFGALFAQIMFAPGALDRQEREMIAGVTAAAQDCFY